MYCPNCGQQQASEEMRFCSRCGLALTGLAEWLAGYSVPARHVDETHVVADSPRRKGIRRAAKLMFFSGVLFLVVLALSLAMDEGAPLLFPCAVFFVSLVWMLYARLFSDKNPALLSQAVQTPVFGSTAARGPLPAAANTSIPIARPQVRTNELAQPPSVTEHTTRLLDNE